MNKGNLKLFYKNQLDKDSTKEAYIVDAYVKYYKTNLICYIHYSFDGVNWEYDDKLYFNKPYHLDRKTAVLFRKLYKDSGKDSNVIYEVEMMVTKKLESLDGFYIYNPWYKKQGKHIAIKLK